MYVLRKYGIYYGVQHFFLGNDNSWSFNFERDALHFTATGKLEPIMRSSYCGINHANKKILVGPFCVNNSNFKI